MHLRVPRWSGFRSLFPARQNFLWLALAATLCASTILVDCANGQAKGQIELAQPLAGTVQSVLEQGKEFERQHEWTEALSHYDQAVRDFPNDLQLRGHQDLARIHYDLAKRYGDTSFRHSVSTLGGQEASELYAEVLLKLDSYYVKEIHWQRLVDRGTRCLEIALKKDCFATHNLTGISRSRITTAGGRLRNFMDNRQIEDRRDAQLAVAAASKMIARDLGITPATVTMEYVAGASGGLDPYSTYLTGDQLRDVYSQIDGNFVGIGIELKADNQSLLIVSVISGSPAAKIGIKKGDRIEGVDGTAMTGLSTDQAAVLLQGEEDSVVELQIRSQGQPLRTVQLVRQHVDVPSIEDIKMVDESNGVGYLRLASFQRSTSRDMDAALWKLYNMGMKSLIVDVRGNPGGLLTAAVDVADKFVQQGTIVSTRGRSKQEDYDYNARKSGTWQVPLVVLVDNNSASASEIFAAAISDHKKGTIVGQQSYG
ncbi:MAG: S41 family peptidase, partial [Planctomycetales bacterium]